MKNKNWFLKEDYNIEKYDFLWQCLLFVSYLFWLNEFKLHATAGPGNEVGVGRVIQ